MLNHYYLFVSVIDTVKAVDRKIIKTFTKSSLRVQNHLVYHLIFHFLLFQKLTRGKHASPLIGLTKSELLTDESMFLSLDIRFSSKSKKLLAGVQLLLILICLFLSEMQHLDLVRSRLHPLLELRRFHRIKSLRFDQLLILMLVDMIFVLLIVILLIFESDEIGTWVAVLHCFSLIPMVGPFLLPDCFLLEVHLNLNFNRLNIFNKILLDKYFNICSSSVFIFCCRFGIRSGRPKLKSLAFWYFIHSPSAGDWLMSCPEEELGTKRKALVRNHQH